MALRIVFAFVALLTLWPEISSGMALALGMTLAVAAGNPYLALTRRWTPILLQFSVVGLGAAMNLATVAAVGRDGISYTAIGIGGTLIVGWLLGRALRTGQTTSLLISVGTAICGGSAIAAVSSAIRAKDHEISVSLATVFFLNATALFIFPWIGHLAAFDEQQFGLWSALAIHDTSSVVGASMQFGAHALEVATTVKLARALWIVPVTFAIAAVWTKKSPGATRAKIKLPWFILGFLGMAALVTWMPALKPAGHLIAAAARRALVLTLFLIGSGLTRQTLKAVGVRPLLQGIALWLFAGSATFFAIAWHWIA